MNFKNCIEKKANRLRHLAVTICFLGSLLLISAPAFAQTGQVTADLLNIRSMPSTDSSVVDVAGWGETLTITYGPSMGWYEVYRNGGCCYVNADYVWSDTGADTSWSDTSSAAAAEYYETSDTYQAETASVSNGYDSTNSSYLGNFVLTAYCGCTACTGGSGITASGTTPVQGRTVAMAGVPFGTKLLINGNIYTVEDRGTSYGHVDIYFNNHQDAVYFGMQYADVYEVW